MSPQTKRFLGGLIALLLAGGLFAINKDGASLTNLVTTVAQVSSDVLDTSEKPANDSSGK